MPHPYPDAPGAHRELWTLIRFTFERLQQRETLLETQWDAVPFAQWVIENHGRLCQDAWMPNDSDWSPRPGESLAHALERSQGREFAEDPATRDIEDRWLEAVYDYRQSHSLRFALRGADISSVVIGCNRGAGEISCTGESDWAHEFDMGDFLRSLTAELSNSFQKAPTSLNKSVAIIREQLKMLSEELQDTSARCC
jgi:hypothetical protein